MKTESARPRGRPREFDRNVVLDLAIKTFWDKGYNGASLDDLTERMGINRPSLYSSFGNKQKLFMEAIDRYAGTFGMRPIDMLQNEPEIMKAVESFFAETIRCVTAKNNPKGCLIVNVAGEFTHNDKIVRTKLASGFEKKVGLVVARLETAQTDGQLDSNTDTEETARMILAVMQSIATRARVGASRKELNKLASSFMRLLFPGRGL